MPTGEFGQVLERTRVLSTGMERRTGAALQAGRENLLSVCLRVGVTHGVTLSVGPMVNGGRGTLGT